MIVRRSGVMVIWSTMKEPGVNNVGRLFGLGCWTVYRCGNPSRYSMKTRWSSAAQRIPIPPGFWTIGSIGDSPLVTTAVAGIVSVRADPISATMRLHGVSFSGRRNEPDRLVGSEETDEAVVCPIRYERQCLSVGRPG